MQLWLWQYIFKYGGGYDYDYVDTAVAMTMTIKIQRWLWPGSATEERYARVYRDAEGLVERAQEEPVPHQGGKDHASYNIQNDPNPGIIIIIIIKLTDSSRI